MPFEINPSQQSQAQAVGTAKGGRPAVRPEAGRSTEKGAVGGGDTVTLGAGSTMLKEVGQGLDTVPTVDRSRVESLKQAINEGTYQVRSARVAEKMVGFERGLV